MGQKVEINGTSYDLKAGKCLVGGTAYAIKKGRTLKDGTGYDVKLAKSLTWLLNDTVDIWTDFDVYIGFTIGVMRFTRIFCEYAAWLPGRVLNARRDNNTNVLIYSANGWGDGQNGAIYRTITFDEEPTGTLLTWLEANGTRQ